MSAVASSSHPQQGVSNIAGPTSDGIALPERVADPAQLMCQRLLGDIDAKSPYGRTYCNALRERARRADHTALKHLPTEASASMSLLDEESSLNKLLCFLLAAVAELHHDPNDPQRTTLNASARHIGKKLCPQQETPLSEEQLKACYQALFATIGWISLIYDPAEVVQDGFLTIQEPIKRSGNRKLQTSVKLGIARPFPNISLEFGRILPMLESSSAGELTELLHVSTLNYYTLKVLGKVDIVWTAAIGSHLELDIKQRKLFIFCLPSYCALCCTSDNQLELLARLLPQQIVPSKDNVKRFLQEILLSYRVIFGQTKKSRSLFKHQERAKSRLGDTMDPLIEVLCETKFGKKMKEMSPQCWPNTCLSGTNEAAYLLEQAVYVDKGDFPILGPRLCKIHRFSERQSPSRVRDMWRDRRQPMQWLAYWAVLWIGGITVVLSILQLVIGIVQVALNVARGSRQEKSK